MLRHEPMVPVGRIGNARLVASAYFLALRAVVNDEDPIGLLHGGAPADEYDPEVADLAEEYSPVSEQRVLEVFEHWFDETGHIGVEAARRIAAGIARVQVEHQPEEPLQ